MGGSYGQNPYPYLTGKEAGNYSPDVPRKKRYPGEKRGGDLLLVSATYKMSINNKMDKL